MDRRTVIAVWHPDALLEGLRNRTLLARLAALGCAEVQLNVADDVVSAAALRLTTFDAPVDAFLTLTGEVEAAELATVLDEVCARWAGWRVESAEPIPTRDTPDGVRLEALANVAVLRRPADLPYDTWREIWQGDHTTVAIETQGTFGYVQHRVLEPLTDTSPSVAAIVEEHFPMAAMTDSHAFYGSGGDDAELGRRLERMLASVARFGADRDLDLVPTSRYRWRLDA